MFRVMPRSIKRRWPGVRRPKCISRDMHVSAQAHVVIIDDNKGPGQGRQDHNSNERDDHRRHSVTSGIVPWHRCFTNNLNDLMWRTQSQLNLIVEVCQAR